ncbi:polyadenylation and cleavage factor homolog 4-like isoform X1 [Lycium barbarum]|uniref:polyadenylation and cleavage factor homolog 4-like isoform X1 n=1 Tax=Lycium barbarum TaxID=112863 RepID=UPI00293F3B75|nr:polyadenylation and cleavage factor homolog 4-like isoform X1 [Lycium barbarum]
MEMEGSRRPFDRSRLEPGPKKPRLMEPSIGNSNGRSFVNQRGAANSRIRETESNDSIRGTYQQQVQQHQELVSQYKTALAELTFNSKPIITNLTIIAGENLQAAKAIAATICNNIIEVPTEQKLPSLYLLDSIVKNIGRDYIKYFATRLPEVFCKAYRQVEPSTHPGMRHLFGTWKGVFPPQQLQLIERELGFTTGVNGSSSGTSRPDPQAQRPGHSIHVNPKYLEARQRLQQSTRAKGAVSDINSTLNVNEDIERPERTTSISSGRSWIDPSTKVRAQKEKLNDHVPEKTISAAYGDSDYGSDLSRRSAFGVGRGGERLKEQGFDKPWYDSGTGKILSQRSGLDIKHGFQSISQKSATSDAHPQLIQSLPNRTSTLTDRSWKNSEEEEYMWDDVNSAAKDRWASEDSDKSDLENQVRRPQSVREVGLRADSEASADSLSAEERGQGSFGNQMSAMWSRESHALDGARHSASVLGAPVHPEGYQTSFSGLSKASNPIGRASYKLQTGSVPVGTPNFVPMNATLESRGSIVQQRETFRAASPSAQSPMHQRPPSPSLIASNTNQIMNSLGEQYQTQTTSRSDPRISQFPRRPNLDPRNQFAQESLAMPSRNTVSVNSPRQQPPSLQNSSALASSHQLRHNVQRESLESEYSGQTKNSTVPVIPGFPDPSSTSSLLAAVLKSGVIGSKSSSDTTPGSLDKGALSSQASAQPPPAQFSPSGPRIPPASVSSLSLDRNASNRPSYSQKNVEQPPLPPPTLVGTASLQPLNAPNTAANPLSSILSTLVAKGLISAAKEESPTYTPSDTPPQTQNLILRASTISTPALSAPTSSSVPSSAPMDKLSLSKPSAKTTEAVLQSMKEEAKSLIGLAFKPDVIRKSHPAVISELLDDVPYQCGICGFGFKLQEKLDRHLEWHASRNPDVKLLNNSRMWYLNSGEWAARFGGLPCGDKSKGTAGGSSETSECTEAMVPADESQCVCVLCGELFEDFYSEESDEWMFKDAVYMSIPSESGSQGPIVHKNCISESSCQELGLA